MPLYAIFIYQSPLNTGTDLIAHYAKSYSIAFDTKSIKEYEFDTTYIRPNSDPTDTTKTTASAFTASENFAESMKVLSSVNEMDDTITFAKNKTHTVPIGGAGAMVYPDILYYPNALALKIADALDYSIKSGIIMMRGFNLGLFLLGVAFLLYISKGLRPYVLLYLSIPTIIVQSMTGVVQGYTYLLMAMAIVLAINIVKHPEENKNKVLFAITSVLLSLYAPPTIPIVLLPLILQFFNKQKITKIDYIIPLSAIIIYIFWFLTATTEVVILSQSSNSLSTLLVILSDPSVFIYKLIETYREFGDWFLTGSFLSIYHHNLPASTYFTYDFPIQLVVLSLMVYALIANQIRSADLRLPKGVTIASLYLVLTVTFLTALLIYIGYPAQDQDYIVGIHGRYHTSLFMPLILILATIKLPKINISGDKIIASVAFVYLSYLVFISSFLTTTNQIFV